MKHKFILFIASILFVFNCFGNTITRQREISNNIEKARRFSFSNRDSLDYFAKRVIISSKKNLSIKSRADYLYKIADIYLNISIVDTAEKYFKEALVIREKLEDDTGIGSIKNRLGLVCWWRNDALKAKKYYLEAIEIHKIHGDKKELGRAQLNLANLYRRWGDYKNSINLFLDALGNYKSANFEEGIAWLNYSIAILYKNVGEYDKSLKYSKQALATYSSLSEADNDSTGIRMCYNQLGFIYTHHYDSLEKGLHYQLEALRLAEKIKLKPVIADAMSGIGQTYYKMGQLNLAQNFLKEAYRLRRDSKNLYGLASNLKFLGYIDADNNNFPEAIVNYDSALVLGRRMKNRNVIRDLYLAYSRLYKKQANFEQALNYYQKYIMLKDSLASAEIKKEVASKELEYEIERKTKENEFLASRNRIQQLTIEHANSIRNFLIILIIGAVALLVIVIFLYIKQRQIKTLKGLIPICASCKKIRNDKGYYEQIEHYIAKHSEADFSHGICPDCMKKLHPEIYEKMNAENYFKK